MKKIIIPLIFISLFIIIPLVNAISVDTALGTSMMDERVTYPEYTGLQLSTLFFLLILPIGFIVLLVLVISTKIKIKKNKENPDIQRRYSILKTLFFVYSILLLITIMIYYVLILK